MKRVTFDDSQPIGARPAPAPRSALACAADGCNWTGTAGSGGRFFCIGHQGPQGANPVDAVHWPAITAKTAELQWFADFIGDVQRMVNAPQKGEQPWQAYAAQFWAMSDETMCPTQREVRSPSLYLYRMLGSLRAMVHGKSMPAPHVPLSQSPAFAPRALPADGDAA